jgi:hypothetical protein
MEFDEERINTQEEKVKELEAKIKHEEEETEKLSQLYKFDSYRSSIDDLVRSSVTCCQKISLYQSADSIDNREEKIIDNMVLIEDDIQFLESCISRYDGWNMPKHVKYLQRAIDRIMEAKYVWEK